MQTAFKPFSPKQKLALRWWALPQYQNYDAIICDGAVRSGKTVCMSLGFVCWATTCFQGTAFALCGKTITALRRNVVTPLADSANTRIFLHRKEQPQLCGNCSRQPQQSVLSVRRKR